MAQRAGFYQSNGKEVPDKFPRWAWLTLVGVAVGLVVAIVTTYVVLQNNNPFAADSESRLFVGSALFV